MKKWFVWLALMVVGAAIVLIVCFGRGKSVWTSVKDPEARATLRHFVEVKEAQAAAGTNGMQPEVQALYNDAKWGGWGNFTNSFRKLGEQMGEFYPIEPKPLFDGPVTERVREWLNFMADKVGWFRHMVRRRTAEAEADEKIAERVRGIPWETIYEVEWAEEAFMTCDEKYVMEYAREITNTLPSGAIYFGNTAPGLFVVEAMEQSHPDGNPFFALSRNKIFHPTYLSYLRPMYGGKLNVPTERDTTRIVNGVMEQSLDEAPREFGRVQDLRDVFMVDFLKINPGRQVFGEPAFVNDELVKRMEPHGLIVKINHDPVTALSTNLTRIDREYWSRQVTEKLGGWLGSETSIKDIADFAGMVHGRGDLKSFNGDSRFVRSDAACELYGNTRAAFARLYAWRADHSSNPNEKEQMKIQADYAYRQAWALSPASSEVVWSFVGFLTNEKRFDEAILVAETAKRMPENSDANSISWFNQEIDQIKNVKAKADSP